MTLATRSVLPGHCRRVVLSRPRLLRTVVPWAIPPATCWPMVVRVVELPPRMSGRQRLPKPLPRRPAWSLRPWRRCTRRLAHPPCQGRPNVRCGVGLVRQPWLRASPSAPNPPSRLVQVRQSSPCLHLVLVAATPRLRRQSPVRRCRHPPHRTKRGGWGWGWQRVSRARRAAVCPVLCWPPGRLQFARHQR